MSVVLDSSALLAWIFRERGTERVRTHVRGASVSTANWSEVVQKTRQRLDPQRADAVLDRVRHSGLRLVPVTVEDAEIAATLWMHRPQLSLGDRLCLALARRLDQSAVTAERSWTDLGTVDVEVIR